ncbi:sigma 54-interacting transcriptional regulator [Methanothrix soehngenii]|uniref:sigma 54-interacting transcriptional regulator n=1 Tax=Methanothrix soehngenii TaxID=2223 RepID=UPI003AB975C6
MQSGFAGSDRGTTNGVLSAGYPVPPPPSSLRKRGFGTKASGASSDLIRGHDQRMPRNAKVFTVVEKVAATNSTVAILGETGTGKELIARALHRISGRSGKLVPVNCGAIPGRNP